MAKLFKRFKDKLFSESREEEIQKQDNIEDSDPNTDIERRIAAVICADINNAITSKEDAYDDTGFSIMEQWEDEYKLLKGGGLQWSTNFAYRSQRERRIRPNSEDNFLHPAIEIRVANLTASPVEATMKGKEQHKKHAEKVTHMSRYNDKRNNFDAMWKRIVHDFEAYGPVAVEVEWDSEWMGGTGPDRFVGEVKLNYWEKEDCIFDPAIRDLQNDMQLSRFAGFKVRLPVRYVQDRWDRFAKHISADVEANYKEHDSYSEGIEAEMVTVYKMYYRGFPEYMPAERVRELRERAVTQEEQGDSFKAQDIYDMAEGNLEGVHLAYYCNDILLEYIPYIYDDGKIPIVFTTKYYDPKCQWGYGEIRNIKIPQVLHNKADEIEIEAMVKEGLGGGYYNKGAISERQLDSILTDGNRGGMWFEVNNAAQIKEREGVKVPQSVTTYKEHKQRMIETVSSNTPIQQGMMPKSNMPFKALAELGARTDIRTKASADKLKDFLIEINRLRINRFAQFYTEERYYRYVGSNNEVMEGTFSNDEIFDVWARETVEEPVLDEYGQPILDEYGNPVVRQIDKPEYFVPEFDIDVNIISKKPDDRNYYTQLAFDLYNRQLLVAEDLFYAIDEGVLPSTEDILEHVRGKNIVMSLIGQIQKLPPDLQQQAQQMMQQQLLAMIQQFTQQNMQQNMSSNMTSSMSMNGPMNIQHDSPQVSPDIQQLPIGGVTHES